MGKTANDLTRDLKEFIINVQSDAHNQDFVNRYRYNNLKLEVLDPRLNKIPQVKITLGISEVVYNIQTGEKVSGGLGPDDRYVLRWVMKSSVISDLRELWQMAEANQGKATSYDE